MLLDAALAAALAWIALGLAAVAAPHSLRLAARFAYPAGALIGLALAAVALGALGEPAAARVLPLGLPDLPFHARLDALSAFFLLLLGSVAAGVSVFSAGYARAGEDDAARAAVPCVSPVPRRMALVLLADDAYFFMVAWETMALSSFFLVTTEHRSAEIRRAGYLYLLIAHLGAIAILLCFGVLQAGTGDYTLRRHAHVAAARRLGERRRSCSRSPASAPRPASCRCTSGCPRRTPRRPRRCRR